MIEHSVDLDEVLSVKQVARRAKWSVPRMRRYLLSAHFKSGGALLVNVGRGSIRPRWTVTLRALKGIAGPWFVDPEEDARTIEFLAEQMEDTRTNVAGLSARVSAQHDRMMMLARCVATPPPLALVKPRSTG